MQVTQKEVPRYQQCLAILQAMYDDILRIQPQTPDALMNIGRKVIWDMRVAQSFPGIGRIRIEGDPSMRNDPEGNEYLFFDPVRGAVVVAYDLGVGKRVRPWYKPWEKGEPYRAISASALIRYDDGDYRVEQTDLYGRSIVQGSRDENVFTTMAGFDHKRKDRPWDRSVFEAVLVARRQLDITRIETGGAAQAAAWHIVQGAHGHSRDYDGGLVNNQHINGWFRHGIYLSRSYELISSRIQLWHQMQKDWQARNPIQIGLFSS